MSRDVARVVSDVSVLCPRAVNKFANDDRAVWVCVVRQGVRAASVFDTERSPAFLPLLAAVA